MVAGKLGGSPRGTLARACGRGCVVLAGLWAAPSGGAAGMPGEDLVPMPTLGGQQFWSDELFFHQWRIQQNCLRQEFRLLDGRGLRHAAGTYEQCRAVLEDVKRRQKLPPMDGKAVIVLHGLGRSHTNMETMARYLHDNGHYTVFNVTYPSTQREIGEHARSWPT